METSGVWWNVRYISWGVAASLISPWLLWWPPAESHYNIYDHSVVGYVSHAHSIVLLYSVGNKITTTTTRCVGVWVGAFYNMSVEQTVYIFSLNKIAEIWENIISALPKCSWQLAGNNSKNITHLLLLYHKNGIFYSLTTTSASVTYLSRVLHVASDAIIYPHSLKHSIVKLLKQHHSPFG